MKRDKVHYDHDEDTILIWCQYCGTDTRHKVLSSVTTEEDTQVNKDEEGYIDLTRLFDEYQTIQCQGCNTLSCTQREYSTFFVYSNSDDYEKGEGGAMATQGIQAEYIYPPRVPGIRKLDLANNASQAIAQVYNETYLALANKQNVLAATGIRIIIEAICLDKSVVGATLRDKITSMVKRGILSSDRAKALTTLVRLGNIAAHQAHPVSEQTIRAALEVVNHLLYTEYVLPKIETNVLKPQHRW